MKNIPFFSIIIPTYNSESTLQKCIDSIFKQTFTNYEILIIDGVSKDGTLTIAKSYNDCRIRIFSELDNGIYDAMNKGIDLANGHWLYFLGSDDSLYEISTLEKISKLSEIKKYDIVYGNVKIIGETGWAKNGTIYNGKFNTQKILNKNICHQAIFYRTEFIKEKVGYFNLKYGICSDWDFNLNCWSKTNFCYIEIIIANFFSGGLSTNVADEEFSNDFLSNILKYFKINAFDKLINSPNFKRYSEVKVLQKNSHPYRFKFEILVKVLLKKLKIK